jgi:CheY-like chemotaxis protein
MRNKVLALFFLLLNSSLWAVELHANQNVDYSETLQKAMCYQGKEREPFQIDEKKWTPCFEKNYSNWNKAALWNRIELNYQDSTPVSFIVKKIIATDDTVRVWLYEGKNLIVSGINGSGVALKDRLLNTPSVAFPIELKSAGVYVFYMRSQTHVKFQNPPTIITPKTFDYRTREARFVMYPYVGAGIAIFFINLLMFFVLRLNVYKPYLIFHFLLIVATIIISGHSIDFLPNIHKGWAFYISPILGGIGLSLIWFSCVYFRISIKKSPFIWVLVIATLSNFVTFSLGLPIIFHQELFFMLTLSLLIYSLVEAYKASTKAIYFAVSLGGYSVFILIYVLTKNSLLPNYVFFRYAAILGHIWEMSFFTVAIANLMISRLKVSQAEVLKSEKSKTRLLQQISHQLRTPMTGILGEIEVLTSERKEQSLQNLVHNSYVLEHTLNNIIDSIDYLPSNPSLNESFVSIEKNLKGIVDQLEREYSGKIKTCEIRKNQLNSKVDWVLYRKFIYQLLDNAFKYGSENSIEIFAESKKDYFEFDVLNKCEDNPSYKLNIQQEFSLRQRGVGVGLGFQIAEKVISDLNGTLKYEYDKGVFKVEIRIPILEAKELDSGKFSCVNESVLVVDDNKMTRKILGKLADKLEMNPEFSVNGYDGVKRFIRMRPKVVFMDIQMPMMDGLSATRAIRQYENKNNLEPCVILAITAHGAHSYEGVCKEAGVDVMLSKPVKLDVLKVALKVA